MHKFFSEKQGADQKTFNEVISSEGFLFESKFIFVTGGPEGGSGSGEPGEDSSRRRRDSDAGTVDTTDSVDTGVDTGIEASAEIISEEEVLQEGFASRCEKVMEGMQYDLPVDIDPNLFPEAKHEILQIKDEINNIDVNISNDIDKFLESVGIDDDDQHKAMVSILYREIPRYTDKDLENGVGEFEDHILYSNVAKKIHEKVGETADPGLINQFVTNVLPKLHTMAKHEFSMIKKVEEVKKVVWEITNSLQKQEIKARKIKLAEKYLGFPLKRGQELKGLTLHEWTNPETNKEEFREGVGTWTIREVYVDTERRINSEDPNSGREALIAGVWISMEDENGVIERFSPSRAKRFVDTHDLKPVCETKEEINGNVPHWEDMKFGEITEGMILNYDVLQQDAEGQLAPIQQEVKIVSLDDNNVTLNRKIIYRPKGSSPDLAVDDEKDILTFGEFSKWLNQRNVIPQMDLTQLQNAVYQHHEYMQKKYRNRNEHCHGHIILQEGEVLYSNAPDTPLYRIEGISEEEGTIKVSNKKSMTFAQFMRWIYANDMEPYTPELEKNKASTYEGLSKKKSEKIGTDTKEIIKYFEEHPEQYRRTREAWEASLQGKRPDPKQSAPKEDYYNTALGSASSSNFLSDFWKGTSFLCVSDLMEIFKVSYEMYNRNYETKQKFRYAGAAVGLPHFGPEFKRIQTQAENEATDYYKGIMESYSVWEVEAILFSTVNPSEMLASFFILSEKGMLRFDDPRVWAALNRIHGDAYQIPEIASGADPYVSFGPGEGTFAGASVEGKTGMDLFEIAINEFFGDGMYLNLKQKNDSGVNDGRSKASTKAQELESDPRNRGGLGKELERLLTAHMAGEFVDPTEFEGLLWYAFESQGIGADARIYFLLMALFATPDEGIRPPLLSWERLGAFITGFGSSSFPVMDFFKGGNRRDLTTGEFIKDRAFVRADLKPIIDQWIYSAKNTANYGVSGKNVNEFFLQDVLTSDPFQKRLEKAIGEAKMDHEDAPYFIPAVKESGIEDVLGNSGGARKKFSVAAFKNTYLGFGWRLHALTNKIKKEQSYAQDGHSEFLADYKMKLADTFSTFVKCDGILDDRYLVSKGSMLQRLTDSDMNSGSVYAPRHIREYQTEMHDLLKGIIDVYAGKGSINDATASSMKFAFEKPEQSNEKRNAAIEESIKNFSSNFDKMIKKDDGAAMLEIVSGHGPFISEESLGISSDDAKANGGAVGEDE